MLTLGQYMALAPVREVDAFVELLTLFAFDRTEYQKRVDALPRSLLPGNAHSLAGSGMLSHMSVLQLLLGKDGSQGVKDAVVRLLIKRAIEWSLIGEMPPNAHVSYMLSEERIRDLALKGILRNVLIDQPEHLVELYKQAVAAVHVDKGGEPYVGTGFVVLFHSKNGPRQVIVTAKHNVDPNDSITVEKIDNSYGLQISIENMSWQMHPAYDLAVSEVHISNRTPLLQVSNFAPVLSETITLGFPRVPTSDKLFLLAHRGEINARVTSYLHPGPYLLISNAVSPGNSGSPVLGRSGLVVGMVTEAFESREEYGTLRMQAALDAAAIVEFLQTVFAEQA